VDALDAHAKSVVGALLDACEAGGVAGWAEHKEQAGERRGRTPHKLRVPGSSKSRVATLRCACSPLCMPWMPFEASPMMSAAPRLPARGVGREGEACA
jgi:hypothetical protein